MPASSIVEGIDVVTLNAMLAAGFAGLPQVLEDPRRTIDTMAGNERLSDQAEQPRIFDGTIRERSVQPRVVAAGRNIEYLAHDLHGVMTLVGIDELVDLPYPADARLCAHPVLR